MGLLHFCFLVFLGCPDRLQERFFLILGGLEEPLGRSWGVLGVLWEHLERSLAPPWRSFWSLGAPFGTVVALLACLWL